ncbi:MAG: hypothetical protein KDD67_10935 [Ignavibacteriae bacterium]|nr:hypothetical protein [Ignavibacteriota bacterium]MCB9215804.1 hypothetical protein [Ignavibacteria bacterium]
MKNTRIVPVIILAFFSLLSPLLLSAQGVGLNLGPVFITDYPLTTSPGFTIGLDYLYSVDDDGVISTALQYSSYPVDKDSTGGLEFSSLKTISLLTAIRFRIAADLDELAPIITLAAGPGFRFGGTNEATGADLVGDIPINVEGWLGAGVDYPIQDDNIALIGQIRYPLILQLVDTGSNVETELVRPGFYLTVGIEYRSE